MKLMSVVTTVYPIFLLLLAVFFLEETARLAAPVNPDQGLMSYEVALIYVASHDWPESL